MAFSYQNQKGTTYYLHSRETTLKNGTKQTIFFFAKEPKEGALNAVPGGYVVAESKNGLPVLKKEGGSEKPARASKAAPKASASKAAPKASKAAPAKEAKPAAKKTTKKSS